MACLCAANPRSLPLATAGASNVSGRDVVQKPNNVTINATSWLEVNVEHPSYFTVVGTQAGIVWVRPGDRGDATSATTLAQTCLGLPVGGIMPFPGKWWLFNAGGAAQSITVHDGSCCEADLSLGTGIGAAELVVITGTGGNADTRNADNDNDFAAALIGLVTNSRMAAFNSTTADWDRVDYFPSVLDGSAASGIFGIPTQSILHGVDTTAGTIIRDIEARDATVSADFAAALIGLVTNSRLAAANLTSGIYERLNSQRFDGVNGSGAAVQGLDTVSLQVGLDTLAGLLRTIEARSNDTNALQFGTEAVDVYGAVVNARQRSSELQVDATAASGSAVTLTLAASGASLTHYINRIEIECYFTQLTTGGGAPLIVTTTNLPNGPTWNFSSASTAESVAVRDIIFPLSLRATTANTATTIVCPATTNVIWNVKAYYNAY